ncbi:Apoptotic protease-activating factor 1 [Cricetulus griseus]|uniref:Apoptotic protease-activating factor 1 n=1 Tax=Cricetulus griseus TaxID=10029 RepID=G3I2M9_CRIGR|nr:Apoptotic protease-activating factor 1 [Cricetulus griseus]
MPRTVLCEGGVPQRPVVFVTRKKLVNAIQQKLWKLNGEAGWVTIYGMAGCGKSVLAAEAVRDHSLLEGPKYVVSVESGLGKEKGLEILSLFVNMKKEDLPVEAHSIIKECKVSLIGALLRDFPNRWAYYLRQLQNKQFKRIRKSSSYDYEALDEAMSISVEMLREDIKDYYTDLSILQKDVKVPTKDLHRKMVTQFQRYYQPNTLSPDQEDCMYWYNFLAYHMASANMHKDCAVCENFQEFLSLNGHLLGRQPFPNIVQLGLCEPETSEVYQQAKLKAKKEVDSGRLYLEWINKKTIKNLSRLVVRPHTDAVYHACFSQDGQRIASCGADTTLQVFKAETGEKLIEVKAHEDEVLCCAFSSDDSYIATCSVDKKVKLWDLNQKECRNTMFGHTNSVNHCRFSPDDEVLASCSADGTLKVSICTSLEGSNFREIL